MDEIDALGGRRFSEGTSADREIQRTLMELLNQLDGLDELGKVYISFAGLRDFVPRMSIVDVASRPVCMCGCHVRMFPLIILVSG